MKSILSLFTGLVILMCASVQADAKDHNYEHITFVNQTSHKVKFKVVINNMPDKSKSLHSHTSKYITVGGHACKQNKSLDIEIDIGDNDVVNKSVKRSCGERLYLYKKDGKYHTSKHYNKGNLSGELDTCDKDSTKPAILFAHGYKSKPAVWHKYKKIAKENGWRVFRTSVSQNGSIKRRAHMLADYINTVADECNIDDDKLRVVGHSMGGLDLRYIISGTHYKNHNLTKIGKASKKIERVYTIATPHRGQALGGTVHASDASRDLGISQMAEFNDKFPYSKMKERENI